MQAEDYFQVSIAFLVAFFVAIIIGMPSVAVFMLSSGIGFFVAGIIKAISTHARKK